MSDWIKNINSNSQLECDELLHLIESTGIDPSLGNVAGNQWQHDGVIIQGRIIDRQFSQYELLVFDDASHFYGRLSVNLFMGTRVNHEMLYRLLNRAKRKDRGFLGNLLKVFRK